MIGTSFGRYDFIQANKAIAPLNTIVRQSGIVLAGIFPQTIYGYSGLYVVLLIADVAGLILVAALVSDKPQEVVVEEKSGMGK